MFTEFDFDPFPLIPGEKNPLPSGWQRRPIHRLWQGVPSDVNIGLRGGGRVQAAFIDCDDKNHPGTFETAQEWLADLGYMPGEYPVIRTASGIGRHIYVTWAGGLPGNSRKLAKDFGAGEFRYGPGAFVVAPPSVLSDGGKYEQIAGDLRQMPRLSLHDVLPILGIQDTTPKAQKPRISRKAIALLHGAGIENYSSRSEAEQSLLISFANVDLSFVQVLKYFDKFPVMGKYAELKIEDMANAERWLQHSYSEAIQWVKDHPDSKARQTIQALMEWAESRPWPGRTGANDKAALIAVAQIAHKAGKLEIASACRDVAVIAKIGRTAAANALHRLIVKHDLLELIEEWKADSANKYRLKVEFLAKLGHSPSTPNVRKCHSFASHDAFRKGKGRDGLGKSAGQVWQMLQENQFLTVDELTKGTGRGKRTVEAALERMKQIIDRKTGEVFQMVASDDGETWHALPVDLDAVAVVVGTAGATEKQTRLHEKERAGHKKALLLGKMKNDNQPPSGDIQKA